MVFYGLKIGERTQSLSALTYQSHSGLENSLFQLPVAISSYFGLFLWPVHLTLYHAVFNFPWWNFSIRAVVTVIYAACLVYMLMKRKPIGFWLSWFLIGLAPTLTPLKIGWVVAERYVYMGIIGLSVLVAMLFDRIMSSKKWKLVGTYIGIFILIILCTRTVVRNNEWRTADSLVAATFRESPEDPKSWFNIGDVYARHGEFNKSIEAFTQATRINPNYAEAYNNIGDTYLKMGKYDVAEPYFEKALAINPDFWLSYGGLAQIAVEKRDYQKALRFIKQAQAINPTDTRLQQMSDDLHRAILGQ
jgi:tetratricopeptide (TPR) repeat protein